MPFNMGAPELLIVLVIVGLVFGVGKLSDVGGAMGKAMREFKQATASEDEKSA